MRIIKEGVKPDSNVRFKCDKCGTIFEADDTEYSIVPFCTYHQYQCSCPICSTTVYAPESALCRRKGGGITTDKIIEEMSLRG